MRFYYHHVPKTCQVSLNLYIARLDRILRRYKFKEAEKFAKTFNLDLDIVYKAHVQKLCHDLDPWNPPKDNASGIFNTIVKLIQEIKVG